VPNPHSVGQIWTKRAGPMKAAAVAEAAALLDDIHCNRDAVEAAICGVDGGGGNERPKKWFAQILIHYC
jgi:hypothetical protein